MSDSHGKRDWKVFESLYLGLLDHFSGLFSKRSEYKVIQEVKGKHIKLVDASIMSVCLSLFPWAKFPAARGRSEERRVGKECRYRWSPGDYREKRSNESDSNSYI